MGWDYVNIYVKWHVEQYMSHVMLFIFLILCNDNFKRKKLRRVWKSIFLHSEKMSTTVVCMTVNSGGRDIFAEVNLDLTFYCGVNNERKFGFPVENDTERDCREANGRWDCVKNTYSDV
jgi:hypothetical protein